MIVIILTSDKVTRKKTNLATVPFFNKQRFIFNIVVENIALHSSRFLISSRTPQIDP